MRDYLWRWDTDWFWCSRAFGVQRPWVRRLAGRRPARACCAATCTGGSWPWRSASTPRPTLDRWRGRPPGRTSSRTSSCPSTGWPSSSSAFQRQVPISPFWLCPLRQRDPAATWELYRLDPATLYVNVGFWSSVPLQPGMDPAHHNRWVEDEVDRLGGRKSLYSTVLLPGGPLLGPLQRPGLPGPQAALRPGRAPARPVRQVCP